MVKICIVQRIFSYATCFAWRKQGGIQGSEKQILLDSIYVMLVGMELQKVQEYTLANLIIYPAVIIQTEKMVLEYLQLFCGIHMLDQ